MSQITKKLDKVDQLVDVGQHICCLLSKFGEEHEGVTLLRKGLIADIPSSLIKILALASGDDLRKLTLMRDLAGPVEEVRGAAKVRLQRLEGSEDAKRASLLAARRLHIPV